MAHILSYKSGKKSIKDFLKSNKANKLPDVLPRSLTLESGLSRALTVTPAEGWFFFSSNEKIAAVSVTGTITGNSTGTAAIACSHKESGTLITVSVLVMGKHSGKE